MSYKSKIFIKENSSELKKILSTVTILVQKQKKGLLNFIKYAGLKQESLALKTGVSPRTYTRWLKVYQEKGIDELIKIPVKGRPPSVIPTAVHAELSLRVNDSLNSFKGYNEVEEWIK